MIKIGTEAPSLHFLSQIAVGGRDDACLAGPALRLTDALVFAVLQHAQQLGLQLERQLADLVQKQAAVASIFEVARARPRWRR